MTPPDSGRHGTAPPVLLSSSQDNLSLNDHRIDDKLPIPLSAAASATSAAASAPPADLAIAPLCLKIGFHCGCFRLALDSAARRRGGRVEEKSDLRRLYVRSFNEERRGEERKSRLSVHRVE